MSPGSAYVTTCLNPWIETPAGIADEFSMPTSCLKFRSIYNMQSSPDGHCGVVIQPWAVASTTGVGAQFYNYINGFTAGTSTVTGWGDLAHPDAATINQNFDRIRAVSCGVKAYYIGAEQSTQGVITVVPLISVVAGLTTMPTNTAVWGNMPRAETVQASSMTEPLCGAVHNFDRPQFHTGADVTGSGWIPSIAVLGLGLAVNIQTVRVEIEINVEVIPKMITSLNANSFTTAEFDQAAMLTTRRLDSARVGKVGAITSLRNAMMKGGKSRTQRPRGLSKSTYKRKRSPYIAKRGKSRRGKKRRTMRKY